MPATRSTPWSTRNWQKLPHREAIVAHFRQRNIPIHFRGPAPSFCFHPGVPARDLSLKVHGWSGNNLQWERTVPATFRAGYDDCLITLPGHDVVHGDHRADPSVPGRRSRATYDVFCRQVLDIVLASEGVTLTGFSLGATLLARVALEAQRLGQGHKINRFIAINPFLYPIGKFIKRPVPVSNLALSRTLLKLERYWERGVDAFLDGKEKSLRADHSPLYAFNTATLGAQLTTVELALETERAFRDLHGIDGRVMISELDERNDSLRTQDLARSMGWRIERIPGAKHTPVDADREHFIEQVRTQVQTWHEEPGRHVARRGRSA